MEMFEMFCSLMTPCFGEQLGGDHSISLDSQCSVGCKNMDFDDYPN